jgi:hypothetical protein
MAWFKSKEFLVKNLAQQFDVIHGPGTMTDWSGIYRCTECGHEAVSVYGKPLPSSDHHQHSNRAAIRWRLQVASTHG